MATPNRAAIINHTVKVLRKHFKPVAQLAPRSVLENTLFACCLENSEVGSAERVFETLQRDYFDWNEVRVSSVRELSEVMKPLSDPAQAATRLKRTLQSIFEAFYSFDLEAMRKQNLGQSVKQLERLDGTTPFVVAFVTQSSLNGHAVPVNDGLLIALHTLGAISENELKKRTVPGLERAIPKNKGVELGSLLHQLGVVVGKSPYGQSTRKLLLEIDPKCKDRLPKRAPKAKEPPPARSTAARGKASKEKPAKGRTEKKAAAKKASKSKPKVAPKKAAAKKAGRTAGKTTPSKRTPKSKKTPKKAARPVKGNKKSKSPSKKKAKPKARGKGSSARLAKRKPR